MIEAGVTVRVDVSEARRWFLELEQHPERYCFETHGGFAFVRGGFGEVGAQFETWEQFYGLRLTLRFELVEIGERAFRFHLIRPPLPIWCAFVIEPRTAGESFLRLQVGGRTVWGRWWLRCPLLRWAIARQIGAEVAHIAASMEAVAAGR